MIQMATIPSLLALLSILGCGAGELSSGNIASPEQAPAIEQTNLKEASKPEFSPKAVANVTEHDFGYCELGAPGEHVFLVRNEGAAPLTLRPGPSSCVCTVGDVVDGQIPPGGTGRVKLSWNANSRQLGPFAQSAAVLTNDPQRQSIEFAIVGMIYADVAANCSEIDFDTYERGQARSFELLVYTQLWDQFRVTKAVTIPETLGCEIASAKTEEVGEKGVKGCARIRVHAPASLEKGHFQGSLRVHATGLLDGQPVERMISLPITGRARVGLTISGPKWNKSGLEFGRIRQGIGAKTALIVKAYGEDTIDIESIAVEPQWIRVTHEPVRPNGKDVGLARFVVEIPEDAPLCNHMTPRCAELRIRIKDLPEVVAQLEFAVTE